MRGDRFARLRTRRGVSYSIDADYSSRALRGVNARIPLLRRAISRIVFRAKVLRCKGPDRGYLRNVFAGFCPMVMGRVTRENDHRAGRISFQLVRVEFITPPDIKNPGNDSVDAILRVL